MRRVVWTPPALRDLEAIETYIAQFSPLAAQRMASRLRSAAQDLEQHAERGRSFRGGRRELVVIRPYLIRYRVDGDTVVILQIRHGARRPD